MTRSARLSSRSRSTGSVRTCSAASNSVQPASCIRRFMMPSTSRFIGRRRIGAQALGGDARDAFRREDRREDHPQQHRREAAAVLTVPSGRQRTRGGAATCRTGTRRQHRRSSTTSILPFVRPTPSTRPSEILPVGVSGMCSAACACGSGGGICSPGIGTTAPTTLGNGTRSVGRPNAPAPAPVRRHGIAVAAARLGGR